MVQWRIVWPEEFVYEATVVARSQRSSDETARATDVSRSTFRPRLRVVYDETERLSANGERCTADVDSARGANVAAEEFQTPVTPYARAVMIRERARDIYHNRVCPACRRASAVPLCLRDGVRDPGGRVNPFTATLVGFRCLQCDHEWPAPRIHH